MTRTIPILIGCLLVIPRTALAAPGPWSEDGSAEAAVLRTDAQVMRRVEAGASSGARGAAYVKQSEGEAAFASLAGEPAALPLPGTAGAGGTVDAPVADVVALPEPDVDPAALQRRYDLERIAKRGRSYFIPGVVLTTLGTIVLIGSIAGLAKDANAVTGALTGSSVAISAVGWPLLVMGVRLRKHPERYLDKVRRTASISPTGFTLRF